VLLSLRNHALDAVRDDLRKHLVDILFRVGRSNHADVEAVVAKRDDDIRHVIGLRIGPAAAGYERDRERNRKATTQPHG
jgi:hypothetical protein